MRLQWLACSALLGLLAGVADVGSVAAQLRSGAVQPLKRADVSNYHTTDLFTAARRAQTLGHCDDFRVIMEELDRRAHVTVDADLSINLVELILFQLPDTSEGTKRI